ncbi:hypothetical protein [Halpernia sp. GG3]
MNQKNLKWSALVAVFYFGMSVDAQQINDTLTKEKKIEEIVMIGYGSRKKVDNTTSISTINSEEVNRTKVLNAT